MQWEKTIGGTGDDFGSSIRQTPDGGYIITGATDSYGAGNLDGLLIKTDQAGNFVLPTDLAKPIGSSTFFSQVSGIRHRLKRVKTINN